jgi:alkanesulfonate monooxygenase SsuD/methylene tetrahydromethanopterin reductase-like flavin-dependent oxidoreductase (luciferase family)
MVSVVAVAANSDVEARRLFTSLEQSYLDARRGKIAPVPPPSNDEPVCRSASERIEIEAVQRRAIVGSPKTVAVRLASLVASTGADELIISTQIYDHVARVRSYELLSGIAAHEPLITEASSDDA